jgi:hypothetical protein
MKTNIKVNVNKLEGDFERLNEEIEQEVEDFLKDIADTTIEFSKPFVDTGTYITSFSYSTGSGRPRGGSSHGKPRRQNPTSKGNQGLQLLYGDIAQLDLANTTMVSLRNGSAHAEFVEYKQQRAVFERIGIKYG